MITLTTDFGISDPYVGILKGVVFATNPSAVIVDITHAVPPQDICTAAYLISSAYRYFPSGSIHVVVVDPGVGSGRSIILVSMKTHLFLAPDNGVLSMILDAGDIDAVIRVENDDYFLKPVSRTFHGRDIFAPVAGHLSMGLAPDRLGTRIHPDQAMRIDVPLPYRKETGDIRGTVLAVDRFGNLITNIDLAFIQKTFGPVRAHDLIFEIGGHHITGLSENYLGAGSSSLLAIIGSAGYIEFSVYCGNAAEFCGAGKGSMVSVNIAQ